MKQKKSANQAKLQTANESKATNNLKGGLNNATSKRDSGHLNDKNLADANRQAAKSSAFVCSGCNKQIKRDKFLLKACDKYWHENCLRCDRCQNRLGELGSSLFCKASLNLCRQDYLEMFGETGICSVCEKLIHASEIVMRAKQNVYHLECFACQLCNQRFCVGDRFYLCENKVVCQYDYEEHILPIQQSLLAQGSSSAMGATPNSDTTTLVKSATSCLPVGLSSLDGQTENESGDLRTLHPKSSELAATMVTTTVSATLTTSSAVTFPTMESSSYDSTGNSSRDDKARCGSADAFPSSLSVLSPSARVSSMRQGSEIDEPNSPHELSPNNLAEANQESSHTEEPSSPEKNESPKIDGQG